MGKVIFRASVSGLVLFAIIVVLNRFDRPNAPAAYGEQDLPPSSLEAGNGAFWLLFLGEPESDGLAIEGKTAGYRRQLERLGRVERLSWQVPALTKPLGVRYWQMIADIPFPRAPGRDWPGFLRAEGERLTGLRSGLSVLLERYRRMVGCETAADFGYRIEWDRSYALRSFVQATAKLHAAVCVLDAKDGRWSSAARELLSAVRFGELLSAGAQTVFFHGLGRSIIDAALDGLAGMMELAGCPPEIQASLLAALPPPSEEWLSVRPALLGEFLWAAERIERGDRWLQSELAFRELFPGRTGDQARMALNVLLGNELGPSNYARLREAAFELFLMKNRTQGYFRDCLDWLLALDASPPFRWGTPGEEPPSFGGLKLWWLWNPSGKLLYKGLGLARQKGTVERKYATLALYDLVRLSAAVRLRRDLTGEGALDPFSGHPYRWDPDRGLLWSIGADREDNGGDPERDLVLPARAR